MKSKKTGKEVVSETKEAVRGALLTCCHIGVCCSSVGSVMVEGPRPFSMTLVSMTMTKTRRTLPTVDVAASEAAGLPRQPLGADGSLTGEAGEGKAQSHWGVVGSNQEMSQGEQGERGVVGEEGMGSQKAVDAGLFAAPEVPTEGLPSSASLA